MRRLACWVAMLGGLALFTLGGFRVILAFYRPISEQASCLKEIEPALRGGIRCELLASGITVRQRFRAHHDQLTAIRVQTQAHLRPLDPGDCSWALSRIRPDGSAREIRRGTWKTAESPDHGFVTLGFEPIPESQGHTFELRLWSGAPAGHAAGVMMCRLDRPGSTLVTTAKRTGEGPPASRIEDDVALNMVFLYRLPSS
ncbi:MAG: hypothetical protein U0800_11470 [Isosphaeraceae bacterium]